LLTLPNNYTNAAVQIAIDDSNDQLLQFVRAETPANATILLNIQETNEYVKHFILLVNEIGGRADLQIELYQDRTYRT
jgi:hypothetical protein